MCVCVHMTLFSIVRKKFLFFYHAWQPAFFSPFSLRQNSERKVDMITFRMVENSIGLASVVNGLIFPLISLTF